MTRHADRRGESGFSLVEVVVAVMLFAVTAMAFFPLVARTSTAAGNASTVASASRMVSSELERVRARPLTTCPAVGPEPLGNPVGSPVTDGRGVVLQTWGRF